MDELTLTQLIERARDELNDAQTPYLWSDAVLTALFNEAVFEANRRIRCIVDTGSQDVCHIALTAGQSEYSLHPSVIAVRRAALASRRSDPLLRTTQATMDLNYSDWRERRGEPRCFVRSTARGVVFVSPVPNADDTLELEVWRDPLDIELMEVGTDSPSDAGIPAAHHQKLVHWVCFRAFMRHDTETEMPQMASMHLDMFESYFGARPTARELQQLGIDPVSGTQAVWF